MQMEILPGGYFCSAFSPSIDFDNTPTSKGTSEQHARKIALALELQQHRLLWLNFLMLRRS